MENRTLHDHDWVNDKDWVIRINSYHINDKDWLNPKYCFTYFKYAACKYFFCVELNKKSYILISHLSWSFPCNIAATGYKKKVGKRVLKLQIFKFGKKPAVHCWRKTKIFVKLSNFSLQFSSGSPKEFLKQAHHQSLGR